MKIWAKYEHFINKKYEQNTTKKHAKYGENMSKIKVFVLKEVRKFDSLHCRIVAIWLNWLEQLTTRRRCPKSQRIRALYEHFSSNARIIRVRVLNTSNLGTLPCNTTCTNHSASPCDTAYNVPQIPPRNTPWDIPVHNALQQPLQALQYPLKPTHAPCRQHPLRQPL